MFAILALAGAAWQPINHVPMPASQPDFEFVDMGDCRPSGPGQPPTQTFVEELKEIGYIHPDFVICNGDLVYGEDDTLDQYNTELTEIQKLVDALSVPFMNVPGNHEISEHQEFQEAYAKRMGAIHGSFDYGGWRFVGVCTDEFGSADKISDSQMEWIRQTVDGSEPTLVFMHRPIFARSGVDEAGATLADGTELHDLFKSHNVKGVFESHDHVFNLQNHDGIQYVITGGAGAPLDAPPQDGGFFHYLIIKVSGGQMSMEVIPLDGIQVVRVGEQVRVSAYCPYDIELNDFTFDWPSRPSSVTAVLDKKGKKSPVQVSLTGVDREASGYKVHVKFLLGKHRQTILTVK